MKTSIIVYPGSNCDRDIANGILNVTKKKPNLIWYTDDIPKNTDFVVLPGGFSFGDYLRSGAIAASSKVTKQVKYFANKGVPILGICNGFQILTESGMLPGTLTLNKKLKFICKDVCLKIENSNSIFTKSFSDRIVELPIAHKMGNYIATKNIIKKLIENDQIAFRYCNNEGLCDEESNPNGSLHNIAGILSDNYRILGMMPHPERFTNIDYRDNVMKKLIEPLLI